MRILSLTFALGLMALASTANTQIPADISKRDPSEPGCNVPLGYDCTTPGFETPLTLDEAIELSKTETVV